MRAQAYAKINLGLVVGPVRPDGKHDIATVLERIDLHDLIDLERGEHAGIVVEGFVDDTLVRSALDLFDQSRNAKPRWRVRIEKRIPVAAGLGGGSSDAATALRLANELYGRPLSPADLHELASTIGSDVPFFLTAGAKLAFGDGTELEPIELPRDYWAVLAMANEARKVSTCSVYRAIDENAAAAGFGAARSTLLDTLESVRRPRDLALLPPNHLPSPEATALRTKLEVLGAFRVDTSGAGPTVYGLFEGEEIARRAERTLRRDGRTWLVRPVPGP
jgi:4-diphosphocytidyl-2-C-methyl-D-erythritol kinase